MSTFGNRLRLLRSERGLYIYEMADALHHAKKTQEDYERDMKMPSIERAMEIANYFGCPLGWLLGEGKTFAYESTTEDFIKVVNAGFQAMAEQQKKSEWVSVKDRLPEAGERVLATDGAFVGEFYINKRGQWNRYNVNNHDLLMALDILFWMPMPKPPEEGTP